MMATCTNEQLSSEVYRSLVRSNALVKYQVLVVQTDLLIASQGKFEDEAVSAVNKFRAQVLKAINTYPHFQESLSPLQVNGTVPAMVRAMLDAGNAANVGPMASVAGAIAESVGRSLLAYSPEVVVENGGDIFLRTDASQRIGIVAESSSTPMAHIMVNEAEPGSGIGVCTSSGRIGPSLSLGEADAATVIAANTALADALATATANQVRHPTDIAQAIDWAMVHGALGVLIIAFDKVAAAGSIQFVD